MTHVVGAELAYGLYLDIELFGIGGRVRWRSLSILLDVYLDIFDG